MRRISKSLLAALFAAALPALAAAEEGRAIDLDIAPVSWELAPGLRTEAWAYGGSVPGTPIVARVGERLTIRATNRLKERTNIHWHGLVVPNAQDGPGVVIEPGETFTYSFAAPEAGTYWYHPHYRPVLDQLDRGLAAPFIVLSPEDGRYTGDLVLLLDDWYLDARGRRLEGAAPGAMERFGNLETVNGKTGAAIEPLRLVSGGLYKLRFISASTASVHTLRVSGHVFRITHLDGHPLAEPYESESLTLAPGERVDAELAAVGKPGSSFAIESDRPELGIRIPLIYGGAAQAPLRSPFVPARAGADPKLLARAPDHVLRVASAAEPAPSADMGMMAMPGMDMAGSGRWLINGAAYPDTKPLVVPVGVPVKLRIFNDDPADDAEHRMDHPMHVHGAVFQVLAVNGSPLPVPLSKDTVPVPAGGFVDVAIVMAEAGTWMFHCHVIDHEDGGMLTVIQAR